MEISEVHEIDECCHLPADNAGNRTCRRTIQKGSQAESCEVEPEGRPCGSELEDQRLDLGLRQSTDSMQQLIEIKWKLANLSRIIVGDGQQRESLELIILMANMAIRDLEKISISHRGNHRTVGPALRLMRKAGRALLNGEQNFAGQIFLKVSEELPEELPITKLKVSACT
jgi:hypothetical protein